MAKTVAGKGSVIDPKKPSNRNASSYTLEENVNEGHSGGKKGKVSAGHGQNYDDMGAKDSFVNHTLEQGDPYRAKGSDFPVKAVKSATGQSGPHGFAEGHNELAVYSQHQEGPRHAEDDGYGTHGSGTPVPGDRSARVASHFPVYINDGEGSSDTGEIGISVSVNLETGHIEGGKQSIVKEVPQHDVHIPAPMKRQPASGRKR